MWEGIGKKGQKIDDCNKLYGIVGGPRGVAAKRKFSERFCAEEKICIRWQRGPWDARATEKDTTRTGQDA